MEKYVQIGSLFEELVSKGAEVKTRGDGYEIIDCSGIDVLGIGAKFRGLKKLSRHKTKKKMVRFSVRSGSGEERSIEVTTDHVCMVYDKDHFLQNLAAKDVSLGDMVSMYIHDEKKEIIGYVVEKKNLGPTDLWVYDLEVDDDSHVYYANDILVHNSQFVSIRAVTDMMIEKKGLPKELIDWPDDAKLEMWNELSGFVKNDLNGFVHDLTRNWCHTEHPEVINYELEYIGDRGIYERKKRYAVRKILVEGPEIHNEIKFSGLELKRSNVSPRIKEFLSDIYHGTIERNWTEQDFKKYLSEAYEKFLKLDITDVAFWKGYNTGRESMGFLSMAKGSTAIASACTYYNQIVQKLKIGKKYDQIRVGNKIRFSYIDPQNRYGIKYIAWPDGQYPDEFREIFRLDQAKMFEKVVLDPLKGFMRATGFKDSDPRKLALGDIDDI